MISAPMPKHGHNVHAVMEDLHVTNVTDLLTPLPVIKVNLMRAGIFPGCGKDCYFCLNIRGDCPMLKSGVQRLMDTQEILFQKTPVNTFNLATCFNY